MRFLVSLREDMRGVHSMSRQLRTSQFGNGAMQYEDVAGSSRGMFAVPEPLRLANRLNATDDTTMPVIFYLVCHNPHCSRPIWLPPRKSPEETCSHSPWPTDGKPRNFACPVCAKVSAFQSAELCFTKSPGLALLQRFQAAQLLCTEAACIEEDCGAPIRILSVVSHGLPHNAGLLQNVTAKNLLCEAGHYLSLSGVAFLKGAPCVGNLSWDL